MQLLTGQADTFPGRYKALRVHTVSSVGIIVIFRGNRAFVTRFIAAVAYKRSLVDPSALFQLKAIADFIADMAGTAGCIAEKELFAGIGLPTPEAVDAEVVGVVETPFIPGIGDPVFKDFIRDGGRVLTEESGNSPEGFAFVQSLFDVGAILDG